MGEQGGRVDDILHGRYRLKGLLGQGGMAKVYLARDEFLGRDVAVKVFRSSAAMKDDLRRQQGEINTVASLSHHSLVTLLDVAVDRTDPENPNIVFVMEFVDGVDLKRRLHEGPLGVRLIAQIGLDLAEGLEYVHGRGVVHRDIKPANVLLTQQRDDDGSARAQLTDFGIALFPDGERVTAENAVTGTVAYISPEQALGERVGPASDIYSFGLVLLECFTGEVAFPGAPVPSAVARLVKGPDIPDTLPPEWRELLTAMTARLPEDRPAIGDIVKALRRAIAAAYGRHALTDPTILPANESARMEAVHRYDILDTLPDGTFDRITAIAARVFSVPIAIVSIVDHDRIWFPAHRGVDVEQIDREPGLCASAIMHDEPWVVENARVDPRALANELVAGEFGVQFYAGVPLRTHDGFNLGTLCVLDFEARTVTAEELATLEDLAVMVMRELDLRLATRRAQALVG
ncbi:MAG: serine/threonine protein kinase [Microbacteriaceae bacterium]|jgi:serine/threonine protein kinase|nr:serine/threonine protein kinase [Microbacteriaceae bacterium]